VVSCVFDGQLPVSAEVLDFWISAGSKKWFYQDATFDGAIRDRFFDLHHEAARGNMDGWAAEAEGALALIIVLDQFSRNLHRNSSLAYANDTKALDLSHTAIARRLDVELPAGVRQWIYMPYMHWEDIEVQNTSIELFSTIGDPGNMKAAITHHGIIQQFGRFPHRNNLLGRTSSAEELKFLADGGFSG